MNNTIYKVENEVERGRRRMLHTTISYFRMVFPFIYLIGDLLIGEIGRNTIPPSFSL